MRMQRWGAASGAAVLVAIGLVDAVPASAVTCPPLGPIGQVLQAPVPGVDWSGCNLKGALLPSDDYDDPGGVDLSGANLSGANLTAATLVYANLTSANLSGTNFTRANLGGANMTGANLTGAILAGTDLSATVRLRNADVTGAVFTNSKQGDAYVCGTPGKTTLFRTRGTPKVLPKGWKMQDGQILAKRIRCEYD